MMTYRWMTKDDVVELGALTQRIWNAHYITIISQVQINFMLAKNYAPEQLTRQLDEGQKFLLSTENDRIKGFLSVGALGKVDDPILRGSNVVESDYFLHKFYLAPEIQGQGVGKALLNELLGRMLEISRLRLQVARKNVNSWNFYLKQGFAIECESDFDIGGGFMMCDYVMEKKVA